MVLDGMSVYVGATILNASHVLDVYFGSQLEDLFDSLQTNLNISRNERLFLMNIYNFMKFWVEAYVVHFGVKKDRKSHEIFSKCL